VPKDSFGWYRSLIGKQRHGARRGVETALRP
jgi:hypothetical protein